MYRPYLPAGQATQAAAPDDIAYEPTGQCVHADAPAELENVPYWHGTQPLLHVGETYVPGPHFPQTRQVAWLEVEEPPHAGKGSVQ
jgi:hypothetical protein